MARSASNLPSKATLARRWPRLHVNRLSWHWRDDATGASGVGQESLLAFLSATPPARSRKSEKAKRDVFVLGWRNKETGATGAGISTFDRETVDRLCAAENAADPSCDHFPVERGA